ncbi:MAG: GNAT family N-acetyltransferase [Flavobacterium sp.]|nr:GNAT family N-acetyltransferase [Flavobacterium sp.]
MGITKLDWDSKFFGFPVGDLYIEKDSSNTSVINSNDFTFFQVRCEFSVDILSETHSLSYFETKIIFNKILNKLNNLENLIIDFDDFPIAENSLFELAYESGKYSRYKQDVNILEDRFKKLYQFWIKNSFNKTFADKIFYFKENENIIGFVTLKINNDTAKIGLIAVSPNYQGKGIGKKLIAKTENYCFENNVKTLQIPTQMENLTACNFYKKMGYEISEKINIKHFWKKNYKK